MADILKVRQEIKDAAKALTLTSFRELANNEEDKPFNYIWLASFNEALDYLLKTGLTNTLAFVNDQLAWAREGHLAFEQIRRFFLDNPIARVAKPDDFPDGSPARKVLCEFMLEIEHDVNPPEGLKKSVAEIERSNCQRNLERLTVAKDAIQRAIALEH
jgi:hypothetical protein